MCFREKGVRRASSRRQPQGRPPWSLCWTAWESYGTSSSTTPSTTWTTSCTPCSSTVRNTHTHTHTEPPSAGQAGPGRRLRRAPLLQSSSQTCHKITEELLMADSYYLKAITKTRELSLFLVLSNQHVCCDSVKTVPSDVWLGQTSHNSFQQTLSRTAKRL